jgi:hypothetical protein
MCVGMQRAALIEHPHVTQSEAKSLGSIA